MPRANIRFPRHEYECVVDLISGEAIIRVAFDGDSVTEIKCPLWHLSALAEMLDTIFEASIEPGGSSTSG